MNLERERALTLAHEAEQRGGCATAADVVVRAAAYLAFLVADRDARGAQPVAERAISAGGSPIPTS